MHGVNYIGSALVIATLITWWVFIFLIYLINDLFGGDKNE